MKEEYSSMTLNEESTKKSPEIEGNPPKETVSQFGQQ
jgi:hypothetical protein